MGPTIRKGLFLALTLVYLVSLTWVIFLLVLSLLMSFPLGWPDDITDRLYAGGRIALVVLGVVSMCVDWYLALGFFHRGRDWLVKRFWLVRLIALLAPILFFVGMVRVATKQFHAYTNGGDAFMPAEYWNGIFLKAGGWILWSLMAVVLVFLMTRRVSRSA